MGARPPPTPSTPSQIACRVEPQKNTALSGLYKSAGGFFTQVVNPRWARTVLPSRPRTPHPHPNRNPNPDSDSDPKHYPP
jgi:hypothetical protein